MKSSIVHDLMAGMQHVLDVVLDVFPCIKYIGMAASTLVYTPRVYRSET